MKKCQTLNSLLKAIQKGETCCLPYTDKARTQHGWIIYQANGTNLLITGNTYQKIEPYLKRV